MGTVDVVEGIGQPIVRPTPLHWLRYVVTGTVPTRNYAWVLKDVTCRTWALRHAARYFVLVTPLVLGVVLFVPVSVALRLEASLTAAFSLFLGYLCFTVESLDRRAEKAGYPAGVAAQVRERRAVQAQRAMAARYRARRSR